MLRMHTRDYPESAYRELNATAVLNVATYIDILNATDILHGYIDNTRETFHGSLTAENFAAGKSKRTPMHTPTHLHVSF